jgi:hypothetical protein
MHLSFLFLQYLRATLRFSSASEGTFSDRQGIPGLPQQDSWSGPRRYALIVDFAAIHSFFKLWQ